MGVSREKCANTPIKSLQSRHQQQPSRKMERHQSYVASPRTYGDSLSVVAQKYRLQGMEPRVANKTEVGLCESEYKSAEWALTATLRQLEHKEVKKW